MATLENIESLLEQLVEGSENIIETSGSNKITYTASGPSGNIPLNPNYYTDLVITLVGGTSTDTNVYLQLITNQPQLPAKYLMNSSMAKIRIEGIKANQIFSDTTLTSGQSLYVYFIGYQKPRCPRIKY